MGIQVTQGGTPQSTIGGTAGTVPVNLIPSTPVSATAASNTAVTVTISGSLFQSVRLTSLSAGYSGAVGSGILTVVVNAVTVLQAEVDVQGSVIFPLPDGGLEMTNSDTVTITLPAGGVGAVGFVNASYFYGS
jgi:hypothetical protein